jgi:hypothetical protein
MNNVPPGSYEVTVGAPGFVTTDPVNARSRTVALIAGETVDDINFALVRGGVITGKVTDAEGRPVIQQQVNIYRSDAFNQQQSQPRRPLSASTSGTTDDRGIFRIFGIAAGQYKVAVGRGEETYSGSLAVGRTSYQQVFHANVSDQAKATIIAVTEGSEANNIDISLGPPIQTFTATGRTVDGEKFTSLPNVRFGLQRIRGEQTEFMNTTVTSNSQGGFVVEGLLPGKYGVFLMPEPNSGLRADATEFEIVDQDVSGLTVRLTKGAGVSGVVVLETDAKRVLGKLDQMQLHAYVFNQADGSGMGQSASSTIAADGSFSISGLPAGTANFSLGGIRGQDETKRFIISRVERDGVVQPRGIEVKEGEHVAGVRVVALYGSATLRGVVNLENGELPTGSSIFVRLGKPDENSGIRPPRVDVRGHFIAEGIPPGVYELSVSVGGPNLKPRMVRQQVTLLDGVATDVVVTIDLASGAKP